MTATLPSLSREGFAARLPPGVPDDVVDRLFRHYEVLRRWAARMALIAQSTVHAAVERHYGESLAAVDLLPGRGRVVDLGSGAGFPGLILAAARPELDVVLVERREKKAAFLRSAARAMGVGAVISTESVGGKASLHRAQAVDCLTARAIRFDPPEWERIVSTLAPEGRALIWSGAQDVEIPGMRIRSARELSDGTQRRVLEFERA